MDSKLKVSETFISLQGEGCTVGKRAVFLRLTGCRLRCDWCDTLAVWQKGKSYTFDALYRFFQNEGYFNALSSGAHLVITGGDPLIQQDTVASFVEYCRKTIPIAHIEVETEGVIMPTSAMCQLVEQWNVSPKLSNSGMKKSVRYQPEVLKFHNNYTKAIFKFPIAEEAEIAEIREICEECHIPHSKVYLMPVCNDRKSFEAKAADIAALAIKHDYHFSPRLHLTIWDRAVGV